MSPVTWGPLRHTPDEAPGGACLQRPAVKRLLTWRMYRQHPAGMVDGPGAEAAVMATPDHVAASYPMAEGILQGAAFQCGIDAGVGKSASGIWGQDRAIG